jgi:hypothetical protein
LGCFPQVDFTSFKRLKVALIFAKKSKITNFKILVNILVSNEVAM